MIFELLQYKAVKIFALWLQIFIILDWMFLRITRRRIVEELKDCYEVIDGYKHFMGDKVEHEVRKRMASHTQNTKEATPESEAMEWCFGNGTEQVEVPSTDKSD